MFAARRLVVAPRLGARPEPRRHSQHHRKLHAKLQRASDDRSPGEQHRELRRRDPRTETDQRRDHRDVPDNWRGVRQQETTVAVQHPKAPGRHDEQARAREKNPYNLDRELTLRAAETGGDRIDEKRCREHTHEHQHGNNHRQQRCHSAGDAVGLVTFVTREKRCIHRNERRGQRALAEQILQKVGDAKRRAERVGGVRLQTEIPREIMLPDEPGDPAEQDARRDEGGRARARDASLSRHRRRPLGRASRSPSS